MGHLFGPTGKKKCCYGGTCCPDRCNTVNDEECDNPLPLTLTATLVVSTVKTDPRTGAPTGCYTVTGTLYLSPLNGWIGIVEGTCTGWCGDLTRLFQYEVRVTCGIRPDGSTGWHVTVQDNLSGDPTRLCTNANIPIVQANLSSSCNPILLMGLTDTFVCTDLVCIIPILDIDEEFGEVRFNVLITEDPP